MVAPMLDNALGSALESGACPHLAVVLRDEAEFAPVVASFYALGAKRGAWLAHRAVEVEDDRRALNDAGLDVAGLESDDRLVIEALNLDEPPDTLPRRLEAGFDAALDRGLTGLWSSHSPVGPGPDSFQLAIAIERAWEERFKGRPVVTLCPYVVEGLGAADAVDRFTEVSELHEEGVLVPSHQGLQTFKRA
jgi:MEDS: MEthanogen/methylotroph, DcmR Sensory domain